MPIEPSEEVARLKTAVLEWGNAAHRQAAEVARLTEENALLGRNLVLMQSEQNTLAAERAPLPEGMETTAAERAAWRRTSEQYEELFPAEDHPKKFLGLLRDHDHAISETARLTAALAEAKQRSAEQYSALQAKSVRDGITREQRAREEEREALLRDIQAMREQYAPLEEGESVMLDTLQDKVEQRAIRARSTP